MKFRIEEIHPGGKARVKASFKADQGWSTIRQVPQMIREQPTLLRMAWHTFLKKYNWPLSQGILAKSRA